MHCSSHMTDPFHLQEITMLWQLCDLILIESFVDIQRVYN